MRATVRLHPQGELFARREPQRRRSSRAGRPADLAFNQGVASNPAISLPPDGGQTTLPQAKANRTELDGMEIGGLHQVFASARAELTYFLHARGMSREDAEDLLQDLFVKIETIEPVPISDPKAYLYRMANNLAHDRRRAEASRKQRDRAWTSEQVGFGDADQRLNAEELLQARDYLRRIDAALDELPERTAAIFRRCRIEGETQKAIASSLGISLSAVEKHLQRAYRVVLDLKQSLDHGSDFASDIREGGRDARSP